MKKPTLRERLLSKAVIDWETGCWEWTAYRDRHGYGEMRFAGRTHRAHRVAYELIEGPIPEGLVIDHLCRNRACINPAHLEPVTHAENTRRAPYNVAVFNKAKTHCAQGHEFTPENTYMKAGCRSCRECARIHCRKQRAQRRAARLLSVTP